MKRLLNIVFFLSFVWPLAYAAEPIQSSFGTDGTLEFDVVKAKVTDNVLTIAIKIRNDSGSGVRFEGVIDNTYYIVKSESKKYHVLRDSSGKWLADPLKYGANSAWYDMRINGGGTGLIWMKFPAPPESETTVDLSVHKVVPFDGLAIAR
jgi:hypothetical protein